MGIGAMVRVGAEEEARIPDVRMEEARRGWNDAGRSGAEGDAQGPPEPGLVRRGVRAFREGTRCGRGWGR